MELATVREAVNLSNNTKAISPYTLRQVLESYSTIEMVKQLIADAQFDPSSIDLSAYAKKTDIPTKLSQLINDDDYVQTVDGIIPSSILPSYVDDVLEYSDQSKFPNPGDNGKIYVDTSTNLTYRWGGSSYVEISKSLALGTTSTTAYRGDHGLLAYQHISKIGNPHGLTLGDLSITIDAETINYLSGLTENINSALAKKLDLIGGELTGFLLLHKDPTQNMHAATKHYVDLMIDGISVTVTQNVTQIKDLSEDLGEYGRLLGVQADTLTEVQNDITGLQQTTSEHTEAFSAINQTIDNINSTISETRDSITTVETNLNKNISDLETNINQDISDLETNINKDIETLKTTTETHTQNISSINQSINSINSTVAQTQTTITTVETNLNKNISDLETNLSKDISDLETNINQDIDAANQEIDNLKEITTTTTENISTITQDIDGIRTSVSETQTIISEVEVDLEQQIVDIDTKVGANATDIHNNYVDVVNQLNTKASNESVVTVNNRVDTLQTSLEARIEVTEEIIENGVSKVVTTSGVFDEDGLTMSKTDAETSSTLNQLGLNIKDSDQGDALYAGYVDESKAEQNPELEKYQGQTIVYTSTLLVQDQLVIGTKSLMEDYEDGTGIFVFS